MYQKRLAQVQTRSTLRALSAVFEPAILVIVEIVLLVRKRPAKREAGKEIATKEERSRILIRCQTDVL